MKPRSGRMTSVAAPAAIALLLAIGGAWILRPASARAAGRPTGVELVQSAGPVGITRGQGILIGLLLPAVQTTADGSVLNLKLINFADGSVFVQRSFRLTADQPSAHILVMVNGDGRVYIDGQRTTMILGEDRRLELAGMVDLITEGTHPPNPCATIQVLNHESGRALPAVQFNFLPAVQSVAN